MLDEGSPHEGGFTCLTGFVRPAGAAEDGSWPGADIWKLSWKPTLGPSAARDHQQPRHDEPSADLAPASPLRQRRWRSKNGSAACLAFMWGSMVVGWPALTTGSSAPPAGRLPGHLQTCRSATSSWTPAGRPATAVISTRAVPPHAPRPALPANLISLDVSQRSESVCPQQCTAARACGEPSVLCRTLT